MDGTVCVVTGANAGLGKATAVGLARRGSRVVMVCRDPARGQAALAEVRAKSGNEAVSLELADLSSLVSVRDLARRLLDQLPSLHVLVNNAALYKRARAESVDGLELMFATNHLGPFLLTQLLLERMKASAPARILNVTAPSSTRLDFDDLQGTRKFQSLTAFGASKMCNLLFTFALARRLEGTGVTVNALHPGLLRSNIMSEAALPVRLASRLFATTPDKAAEAGPLWLATAPELERASGRFYRGHRTMEPASYARDVPTQEKLWAASEALVGSPR